MAWRLECLCQSCLVLEGVDEKNNMLRQCGLILIILGVQLEPYFLDGDDLGLACVNFGLGVSFVYVA